MKTLSTDIGAYYAQCGSESEIIYAEPERQAELALLHQRISEVMRGHHVLEIACGSGYWTVQLAQSAASVLATDLRPELIAEAEKKNLPDGKVRFGLANSDALPLNQAAQPFSACFAGFFWSHVKRQDQAALLDQLRQKYGKNLLLVMVDDNYIEGGSTPVARTDKEGNTYQIRTIANGDRYELVKNYPSDSGLRKRLASAAKDIRILRLENYWMLSCILK
jgi:protein-L-isoaspartate O-methyltransferase